MLHTEGHALLRAVGQGKLRLARLLLEGGAYVNEGDAQGETALMAACRARYDDPQNKARMVYATFWSKARTPTSQIA